MSVSRWGCEIRVTRRHFRGRHQTGPGDGGGQREILAKALM